MLRFKLKIFSMKILKNVKICLIKFIYIFILALQ